MRRRDVVLSLMLWLAASGVAAAASAPDTTVKLFIDAHLQGRFAEAHSYLLGRVEANDSLFSTWLFSPVGFSRDTATADVFLSRKFAEVFRYKIIGVTRGGENLAFVTAIRSSPNLLHLYTWALAPQRGAPPYKVIEAIDNYLTKVNFPIEESNMTFSLIRENDSWYINAIRDEKFAQLQQQVLRPEAVSAAPTPSTTAAPPSSAAAPVTSAPPATPATPTTTSAPQHAPPTTTSGDIGRQTADAQFNATLQSFNYMPRQTDESDDSQSDKKKSQPFNKFLHALGLGESSDAGPVKVTNADLGKTFKQIREALARYAIQNSSVPEDSTIYNWPSLRKVVNFYTQPSLPATEEEVGFRFVSYRTIDLSNYTLLVELERPQDGLKRLEITPNGILQGN